MSLVDSGPTTGHDSEAAHRADWTYLVRVLAWVLILPVAFVILQKMISPAPGLPGMVEIQLAGTRETLVSLLRAADHVAVRQALLWDTIFILVYGAVLALALDWRHFGPSQIDRLEEKRKDQLLFYTPWFLAVAVVSDILQNLLLLLSLSFDALHPPIGTAVVATVLIVIAIVNMTFFIAVVLQCMRNALKAICDQYIGRSQW